jgi:RNA polymerase sigma-70 factor (ECF subfamily)
LESSDIDRLFGRVARGERAAVEPAFRALRPIVQRYCLRLLQDDADAEDATQTSLIKMFEQAPEYNREHSAVGWALSIAFFECRTERKKRSRKREVSSEVELSSRQPTAEAELSLGQWRGVAEALLAELSPEDRALLEGREEEVGRELAALAPATRRKRKQRLVERLKDAFRDIVSPRNGDAL